MKVFLSHSSKDKGFVEAVAQMLRPGTFELDSQTFDAGIVNSQAIIAALKRCDLFCLFLSASSVSSSYVDFETLVGIELLASGKISRFVAVCLDEEAFEKASVGVKFFNVVRKGFDPSNTARLIQGHLVSAAERSANFSHPFVGREDELLELEKQITDHRRPPSKAVFISGNLGAGRRTIAQKFYEHHYPSVGRVFPVVNVELFAGVEELYRKVLAALRPGITAAELRTRIQSFTVAPIKEKRQLVAQLLNSLLPASEAAVLMDRGGILTDAGNFTEEINGLISHLDGKPHPPVIIVAPRMIPMKLRRPEDDLSYLAVRSLKRNATERLISRLLKDLGITLTDEALVELVRLGDGHPFNIYRMVDEISDRGLDPFLANPADFIDWKHRQSSEYLAKITFSERERSILGLLKQLPEVDFAAIVAALELDPHGASEGLLRLNNFHIVESVAGNFTIAPALRVAVERDTRFRLPPEQQKKVMKNVASSLSIRLEDGTAPISLIDAALLSSLESGEAASEFAVVFLLPSHHIWLAKRHYDQKRWDESKRFAIEALRGSERLSSEGFVAACRYICLSAARLGQADVFEDGIAKLVAIAKDDWAKSNIAFLNGFNFRFKGNLPRSEEFFREAYKLSPGNSSAAREIAAICLARDNLDEAELFAREAHSHGPTNAYLLDVFISVLVRKHGRSAKYVSEINDLFDVLEKVGDEGGRSFFTTRRAEFEHLWGNNKEALRLIEEAIRKTPTIFEPRRLYAEILLKDGNKVKAHEAISKMHEMVNARDPDERRTHYRVYLKTYSHYLVEVGRFREAKEIYDDQSVFTTAERDAAIREIEIIQGFNAKDRA